MKRRHIVKGLTIAGIGTSVGAALALKPQDRGAPYTDYFSSLNQTLQQTGEGKPHLLIDLDALDRNIDVLMRAKRPEVTYRLVEKSLPVPALIEYILQKTGSQALMSFHLPFLQQDTQHFPDSDILLGKPLPAKAVDTFYQQGIKTRFTPDQQLAWLVDTEQRLIEYQRIAQARGTRLRINLELDVGLHRGGFASPLEAKPLLDRIKDDPQHLEFAGFMGYDAHVGKIPSIIESREKSYQKAVAVYQSFIDFTRENYPGMINSRTVLNGAGSPTFTLHQQGSPCNDLSAGSCLVKPVDFDLDTLTGFVPAAFIATPVLKTTDGTMIPGIEPLTPLTRWWNPNWQQGNFVYGGRWLAKPHAPAGVSSNALYGYSSNQQLYTASRKAGLAVNDHLFLRPTQSEAVFLQFGHVLAYRQGNIEAQWPILKEALNT